MRTRAVALSMLFALLLAACSAGGEDSAEYRAEAADDGVFDMTTTIEMSFDDDSSDDGASGGALDDSDSDSMEQESVNTSEDLAYATTMPPQPAAGQNSSATPNVAGQQPDTDPATETPPDPIDTGRDIIRTAVVTVEVPDVAAASQEAIDAVSSVGGLLFNQDTRISTDGGANRTTLVFRVPPRDFQRVLNELSGIGELVEKTVDATDVTGRVVDLESRIRSTELSVDRLRGFLADATDLTQVATFENELRNRETDLETLRGQLRTLQNQVALSTITVSLVEKLPPAKPTPSVQLVSTFHGGHDGGFSCGTQVQSAESGSELSFCVDIRNTGETALTDIDLKDAALSLSLDDFELVQGTLEDPLQPGQSVVLVHEFSADGNRVLSTAKVQATAVPAADSDDPEVSTDTVSATTDRSVSVVPKQTEPGFAEGLRTGWDGLTALVGIVLVALGFLLPFIWAFPLAFFGYRAWRRRFTGTAVQPIAPLTQAPAQPVNPAEKVDA